jgi:hypothetical protein
MNWHVLREVSHVKRDLSSLSFRASEARHGIQYISSVLVPGLRNLKVTYDRDDVWIPAFAGMTKCAMRKDF